MERTENPATSSQARPDSSVAAGEEDAVAQNVVVDMAALCREAGVTDVAEGARILQAAEAMLTGRQRQAEQSDTIWAAATSIHAHLTSSPAPNWYAATGSCHLQLM